MRFQRNICTTHGGRVNERLVGVVGGGTILLGRFHRIGGDFTLLARHREKFRQLGIVRQNEAKGAGLFHFSTEYSRETVLVL